MNINKPQEKLPSPTKEPPSSASEDEQSDGKGTMTGAHKPRYAKRKPSEQHGASHATSLIHQLYEKKHQLHLQQLQQNSSTGEYCTTIKLYDNKDKKV